MNRVIRAATAAMLMAGGLGSVGCYHRTGVTCEDRYRNAVDTNWPDRYNYAARQSVLAPFAQQAFNGHFLEQVVYNWYFDFQSDKLNGAGREKLDALARATPSPDPKVYIQEAYDIGVTDENIDKVAPLRNDLNARRAAAVQRYLGTHTGHQVAYEFAVASVPTPGIAGVFAANAFRQQARGYVGAISGAGGFMNTPVSSGITLTQTTGGIGGNVGGPGSPMGAGVGAGVPPPGY